MSLNEEERMALTAYRIQKAHDTMEYVHGNVRLGYWPVVANRLYYAAYYAVTALLIKFLSIIVIIVVSLHFKC